MPKKRFNAEQIVTLVCTENLIPDIVVVKAAKDPGRVKTRLRIPKLLSTNSD